MINQNTPLAAHSTDLRGGFCFIRLLSSRCGQSAEKFIQCDTLRFLKSLFFAGGQTFSIFGTKIIHLIIKQLHNI